MTEHLKKRKSELQDTPQELISIPARGLAKAKLGMRRGLSIHIDHPLVPKELLEKHEMEYPVVDFVD
jgi:hypothetical protein